MPYVFWRNLVLGDPMAAPWARRPRVSTSDAREAEVIVRPRRVTFAAEAPNGASVATTTVYVDGVARATSEGPAATLCLEGDGPRELLAVAQLARGEGIARHASKGWTRLRVTLRGATGECRDTPADAAVDAPDVVADVARDVAVNVGPAASDGGCGCRAASGRARASAWWMLVIAAIARLRLRRCAQGDGAAGIGMR